MRPPIRLIGFCLLAGVIGGLAALGFEALVGVAEHHLIGGLGRTRLPAPGSLDPELSVPSGWARLWIPAVTTLGGLLSGWLVFWFAPEAAGHGPMRRSAPTTSKEARCGPASRWSRRSPRP